jgi:hypothetical protein
MSLAISSWRASIAAATSSAPEDGNSPTTSLGRQGLWRSYTEPLWLGVHRPAMKFAAGAPVIVSDNEIAP